MQLKTDHILTKTCTQLYYFQIASVKLTTPPPPATTFLLNGVGEVSGREQNHIKRKKQAGTIQVFLHALTSLSQRSLIIVQSPGVSIQVGEGKKVEIQEADGLT